MTEVYGPDFITLLVADLEASVRFYKDKIGLIWLRTSDAAARARS
jgi:catechol 2,3-dioxygenase-like lactoylglutathione lyase family enzyme